MKNETAEKVANDIISSSKNSETLSEMAKGNKLKVKTSELFGRNWFIPEIGYVPSISEASFKLEKTDEVHKNALKKDNVLYVISLNTRSVPDSYKDDEEEEKIKTRLEEQKKNVIYSAWVDKLRTINDIKILTPELFE